jgi:hypothetical protein
MSVYSFSFQEVAFGSLPFVNSRVINKLNQDFETMDDLWLDCLKKGFDFLVSDFESRQDKVVFGETLFNKLVGGNIKESVAADGLYHGFKIKVEKKGYYTINLTNISGDFNSLKVLVDGVETVLTLDECSKGVEIDGYNCQNIFIGFLNEGYETRKECKELCCGFTCMDSIEVLPQTEEGVKIDTPFSFSLNIYSDIRPYILSQWKPLKMPLLYRAGMYLFQYAQTVDRVNVEGMAFKHSDVFEYYETEYNKYLTLAVGKFQPPKEGTKPKTAIQYINTIP